MNNYKKPSKEHSVVTKHILEEGHDFKWNEIRILSNETVTYKRKFTELALIKKHQSNTLNKQTDLKNWKDIYNPLVEFF